MMELQPFGVVRNTFWPIRIFFPYLALTSTSTDGAARIFSLGNFPSTLYLGAEIQTIEILAIACPTACMTRQMSADLFP